MKAIIADLGSSLEKFCFLKNVSCENLFFFSIIIFGSRLLRLLLGRPENFYAKKAVDSEDYPGMEEK